MNATQTGWAANVVGLFMLIAAARGIDVSPEVRELLILVLSSAGLAINQFLIALAQRQPAPAQQSSAGQSSQSGFITPQFGAFLGIVVMVLLVLPGCGALNTYTGATLSASGADYAGARKNIQSIDDLKFMAWADAACALPIGALQRNATQNPRAVPAALAACPIPNVGVVNVQSGGITVELSPK